jgi:transcriptional regulator with XRE-family HTH domain
MLVSMSPSKTELLSAVIGRNVRTLREMSGRSQDLLSRELRSAGLNWTRSQLAKAERGERGISIEELVILADALGVPVSALVASPGRVALTPQTSVSGRSLQLMLEGKKVRPHDFETPLSRGDWSAYERGVPWADANARAAQRLGATKQEIHAASVRLWGRVLLDEREARVEELTAGLNLDARSLQAARGHTTRTLMQELAEELGRRGRRKR